MEDRASRRSPRILKINVQCGRVLCRCQLAAINRNVGSPASAIDFNFFRPTSGENDEKIESHVKRADFAGAELAVSWCRFAIGIGDLSAEIPRGADQACRQYRLRQRAS